MNFNIYKQELSLIKEKSQHQYSQPYKHPKYFHGHALLKQKWLLSLTVSFALRLSTQVLASLSTISSIPLSLVATLSSRLAKESTSHEA